MILGELDETKGGSPKVKMSTIDKVDKYLEEVVGDTPLLRSRGFRRLVYGVLAFGFAIFFLLLTVHLTNVGGPLPNVHGKILPGNSTTWNETASGLNETTSVNETIIPVKEPTLQETWWPEAEAKWSHLRDDKFTIVMQTYQRPIELNATLTAILSIEIPSLLEVVIVWNELEAQPPYDFYSPHGIPVRFRVSKHNSLNEKLWPDPNYKTQALLLSDDDVNYHPKDLEFVFQAWRKYGRNKLVGALPRCSTLDEKGSWNYDFCSRDVHQDVYSMIITNLCFSHIAYLDYYSSEEPHMRDLREYVDAHFNCEDIGLNFVTGYLTGEGPLLVMGRDPYYNQSPHKGISTKIGHLEARSQCLNDFVKMFGRMTLVNSDGHITKGVVTM